MFAVKRLSAKCNQDRHHGVKVWTAGHTVAEFMWTDSIENRKDEMPFTNWARGEPNWPGIRSKACLSMCLGHKHVWEDEQCYKSYCFVCEDPKGINLFPPPVYWKGGVKNA